MPIYLDHNAGSPLRPEARRAIRQLMASEAGNPASVHRSGQRARGALEQARAQVAAMVGAEPGQIVFTGGGTESNNMATFGAAAMRHARRRVITSAIEHSSILAPLAELERSGCEVVRLVPDRDGRIPPESVVAALNSDTALVTIGLANAEVGAIQDVAGIATAVTAAGALLHVDAAQAVGRIEVEVAALGCDLMTLSGHKIGGPAGIGALYIRDPRSFVARTLGGPQERGLRAGTPNLIGAVGFGAAAEAAVGRLGEESSRLKSLSGDLLGRLRREVPGLRLNGPMQGRIPNTLNLTFPDVSGESLLIALDLAGVEVSMGSACAAGAVEPSHVLLAMGLRAEEARSSLRLSLGWCTTEAEVAAAAEIIPAVWRRTGVSKAQGEAARGAP